MNPVTPTRLQHTSGAMGITLIKLYLHLFGRKVAKAQVPWLGGPIGPRGEIGGRLYQLIADEEGLAIDYLATDVGLLTDFAILAGPRFDIARLDPAVRRFYEHTSRFELDTWSETRFPGRLFLWLIVSTVSRHMNQLNFPVFGLETSRGMTSEILPLRDASGRAVYTGWQRRLAGSGFTIYAGFYSTVQPPGWPSPCVKVVFPLPEGNATAILHPEYNPQGHFRLISKGRRFGDPGFYRILELNSQQLKVRYLRSLHEEFDFYTDERGILRCDHIVRFLGVTMLRLHYRIRPKN